jgi:hypothetical protein
MHGINHPKVEVHVLIPRKSHHTLLDTACFEQFATSFAGSTELYPIIPDIFSKAPMLQIVPWLLGSASCFRPSRQNAMTFRSLDSGGALLRFFVKKRWPRSSRHHHDPP